MKVKVFRTSMYDVSTLDVHREKMQRRLFSHVSRAKRRFQKQTKISHLTITVKQTKSKILLQNKAPFISQYFKN
jgi:hypothetical protein